MARRAALRPAATPAVLLVSAVLTACSTGSGEEAAERAPGSSRVERVERVVDGDTVVLADRERTRVRLIGIDTPESVSPHEPPECWGAEASARARELLEGERVELRLDPSQGRVDDFGRTLAYLHLPEVGDVGLALIREGAAAEYTFDEAYALQDDYRDAEQDARDAGRGLWGACHGRHQPLAAPAVGPRVALGTTG